MNIEIKREYLLKKLSEKENLVCEYDKLKSHLLLRRMKKLILFREKYLKHCLTKWRLLKDGAIKARTFWGREMFLSLPDDDSLYLYFFGTLGKEEFKLTKFLIKNLKQDEIFYDIGANYGFYSLLVNEIITKGEIHAFEPHPQIFAYLKKIILKDGGENFFLNNFAISNKNKIISLFDGLTIHQGGTSTILKELAMQRPEIKTKAITLDRYTRRYSAPTFIKLDIEGAEEKAILGSFKLLKRYNPIIAMEVWRGEDGEKFSSKAINLLYKLGYSPYNINDDGGIMPISQINFNQIETEALSANFIFKNDHPQNFSHNSNL